LGEAGKWKWRFRNDLELILRWKSSTGMNNGKFGGDRNSAEASIEFA
jgi:hypothetical protein